MQTSNITQDMSKQQFRSLSYILLPLSNWLGWYINVTYTLYAMCRLIKNKQQSIPFPSLRVRRWVDTSNRQMIENPMQRVRRKDRMISLARSYV
jgi:hypothetical protein